MSIGEAGTEALSACCLSDVSGRRGAVWVVRVSGVVDSDYSDGAFDVPADGYVGELSAGAS